MDELQPLHGLLEPTDPSVSVDNWLQVAALRYFEGAGEFAAAVKTSTGLALPGPLEAVAADGGEVILAWRSPTETCCLTGSAARLSRLATQLARAADGCLVDLSGGLKVVRVAGERIPDLLCRLGGSACVPQNGEARRGRLADVPVLALSARAGETLLVVDRAYLPHVLGWIRETLLDFPGS
jgi:Sarcosine oxidase, gamma subunit family